MYSIKIYSLTLILIICHIHTVITAEIIQLSPTILNKSTITNDSIFFIVDVANCSTTCSCLIETNKSNIWIPVIFSLPLNSITHGYVNVDSLQPYTLYSFEMNCSEIKDVKTAMVRTDVFRPSPPRDFVIIPTGQRLELKWKPPIYPQGPINNYRIVIDGVELNTFLNNNILSYLMNSDYLLGTSHQISVIACNIDSQDRKLCSNPKDSQISYSNNNTDINSTIATTINTIPIGPASIKQYSFIIILFMQILVMIYSK